MKYINKQDENNKREAHEILDDFLTRFHEGDLPFPEDMYDALKSDRREGTNTFLQYAERILSENEYRCCYCMRTLRRNNAGRFPVTLEHVILKSICEQIEYDQYYDNEMESDLEREDMVLTKSFVDSPKPNWPPYPHQIAYENLIPSCFGLFPSSGRINMTCNLKRGNNFVPPLTFRPNIEEEIMYYTDGTVAWTQDIGGDDIVPYINRLGLNYIGLRLIRLAWYCLSSQNYDCDEDRIEYVKNCILADVDENTEEGKEIVNNIATLNQNWSLMNDYRYFNDVDKFTVRE